MKVDKYVHMLLTYHAMSSLSGNLLADQLTASVVDVPSHSIAKFSLVVIRY